MGSFQSKKQSNSKKALIESAKTDKENKIKETAISRQKLIEKSEICQIWKFVFGENLPQKNKSILKLQNVSPRNIWMEALFLFNEIRKFEPDKVFHDHSVYALKWQPPGGALRLLVPMEDCYLQEQVIIQISRMSRTDRNKVLFHFAPRNPGMYMFAPNVHPASLVSYRTRNEVLLKLCDNFLKGKILINDLQETLAGNYDVWKMAVYNMLPEDEQAFHSYLSDSSGKEEVVISTKIEKDYLRNRISLSEYSDQKFPERKKKKDMNSKTYPEPYIMGLCVICGNQTTGIIKCKSCNNLACVSCIHRRFLDEATKEGSFLLMHRRFCLRLGKLLPYNLPIAQEAGYVKELHNTGREHALSVLFTHSLEPEILEEDSDMNSDGDENSKSLEEMNRLRIQEQEEMEKRLKEVPLELEKLSKLYRQKCKRYEHLRKEIIEYQDKLDATGHNEKYTVRNERLKMELIEKVMKGVHVPLLDIQKAVLDLKLPPDNAFALELLHELNYTVGQIKRLAEIKNSLEFESNEQTILAAWEKSKSDDLIAKSVNG